MGADSFAVSIDVEFNGCRRDHACETGSQAAEECSPSFCAVDVADYSGGFMAFEERFVGGGGSGRPLVEIGLETCSEDIEG
jgi:hypothetical protein